MNGLIGGIAQMLGGSKGDDYEVRISRNRIKSLLESYEERVTRALENQEQIRKENKEFREELITRMKSLEGKYGDARKVLVEREQQIETLQDELATAQQQMTTIQHPEASDEARAAQELLRWGYTESQMPAILKVAKENEMLLIEAAKDEDGEPVSIVETLRKNRILVEIALKNKGIVKGSDQQNNGVLPGVEHLGKGF